VLKGLKSMKYLQMKWRTSRASLLYPLTLFSFPTLSFFFSNYCDNFGLIFGFYRGLTTCRLGHGSSAFPPSGPVAVGPTADGCHASWKLKVKFAKFWNDHIFFPKWIYIYTHIYIYIYIPPDPWGAGEMGWRVVGSGGINCRWHQRMMWRIEGRQK
jgi:hypothetical protein